jgi:hypothetical protein
VIEEWEQYKQERKNGSLQGTTGRKREREKKSTKTQSIREIARENLNLLHVIEQQH